MARSQKRTRRRLRRQRARQSARASERAVATRPIPSIAVTPHAGDWAGPNGDIGTYIRAESAKSLESYRTQPNLVAEHANTEEDTARGGYANRQLFELVQNSADALSVSAGERIRIRLTSTHLYCADNGQPINRDGVRALLFSHLSAKRNTAEIGRFGLGFKSVLGVTDTPEFFSIAGSFRFDRARSAELLKPIAPGLDRYPVLRLAEPMESWIEIEADPTLREMASWATNIVRVPLKPSAAQALEKQIVEFPAEFMLFVNHIGRIELSTSTQEATRTIALAYEDRMWKLDDSGKTTSWMVVKATHALSQEATADSRSLDNADEVPIWWAAPIERLNDPGRFWAFFPTDTTSLLAGILNAPWKTNEDRQNLLPGVYNDELIDAAAAMVAETLPTLATTDDPGRHLDALPRREEPGDSEHSDRLRNGLHAILASRRIIPNEDGRLQRFYDIQYPPDELVGHRPHRMQSIIGIHSRTDQKTGLVEVP